MRPVVRPMLRAANRVFSSPPIARRLLKRSVVVFLYHEVSDRPSRFNEMFGLNVRPSVFAQQLDLIRRSFHLPTPRRLLDGDAETPAALVTFDDGNASYFQQALPILRAHGVPSVSFLNFASIHGEVCWSGLTTYLQYCEPGFSASRRSPLTGNDYCRLTETEVRRYLDTVDAADLLARARVFRGAVARQDDLDAAADEPLVFLGNHLHNHYNATLLGQRLRMEFRNNQALLDRHPRGTRLLSYPFSCRNDETDCVLREEGAEALFAGGQLPNRGHASGTYTRVELGPDVVTEQGLLAKIFENVLSAASRGRSRLF